MHADDRARLEQIADAQIAEGPTDEDYAPASPSRMAAAAQDVLHHADQFDLDGAGPGRTFPASSYIASLITDLLVLSETLGSDTAATVLDTVAVYAADAGMSLPTFLPTIASTNAALAAQTENPDAEPEGEAQAGGPVQMVPGLGPTTNAAAG